jgi:hypothetical protein
VLHVLKSTTMLCKFAALIPRMHMIGELFCGKGRGCSGSRNWQLSFIQQNFHISSERYASVSSSHLIDESTGSNTWFMIHTVTVSILMHSKKSHHCLLHIEMKGHSIRVRGNTVMLHV